MKAARCRIAGAGDFEKGWNRLFGFNRTRVPCDWSDVEAEDELTFGRVLLFHAFCAADEDAARVLCTCESLDCGPLRRFEPGSRATGKIEDLNPRLEAGKHLGRIRDA